MSLALSVNVVSRYSEDRLCDLLSISDVRTWMRNTLKNLRTVLGGNESKTIEIESSPEGLLFCALSQQQAPDEEIANTTLHTWTDVLLREIGHHPLLFYLTLGATPQELDGSFLDEGVYRIGGPLILIEENLWNQSKGFRERFTSSGVSPFFKKGMSVVIREPETQWLQRLGENLDQLKNRPYRHPLDYNPDDEAYLSQEKKKQRKLLDKIINLPSPGQRQSIVPEKVVIELEKRERSEDASRRAYQDVPVGQKKEGKKTVGGRSLLVACNKDVNLIAGWREGDPLFEVHNAVSLHFYPSVKQGSLPEAITSGRVVLKKAWIQGKYIPPELPKPRQQPNRMIWPQYNLPQSGEPEKKE